MSATSDHSKRPSGSFASQGGSPEERLLAALMSSSKTAVLPREVDRSLLPLSFAQERLWFLDQWEPGSPVYNIYYAYRLLGRLNVTALEESLNEVVRRHEVLRTTFGAEEGRPCQVIAPRLRVPLVVVELGGLPEEEREAEVVRLAREEAGRPFDLARGPLVRATVLRLGDREHVLLLTVHHIVFDGWSVGIFWRELGVLYETYSKGERSLLGELAIQYADYALWQREWLQGEVLEEQVRYWREQLAGIAPSLELPTDRARPAVQSYRGAEQKLELGSALCAGLKALSRGEGVTLFMTLLAAYQVLLHRYTGQDDIAVGSPIANRNQPEVEGLIGFFVNTLVLRSVLSGGEGLHSELRGNPTFRELLGQVGEVCFGAYEHQDLPFEILVAELQPERDPGRTPLFQAAFQLQNYPREESRLGEVRVQPLEVEGGTAKFDVSLSMEETGAGLLARLRYHSDLFDAGTMERMLGHYRTLLEGIVADADERVGKLPLLTGGEWRQIVVEWNDTDKVYPGERCVHELFEEQAERMPDAVAVVCEDQQLTYGELNAWANQVADYLRQRGVGPDVLVGISLERSVEVVMGILAILKAGGAYVPLDPAYPKERLAMMLQDAQPPVLLTREALLSALPASDAEAICLDSAAELIARQSQRNPGPAATPDNLAYAIFTSGSTGRPNGVLIAHRGLRNVIRALVEAFDNPPGGRFLHLLSFSFDAATGHLFATLCSGATLYLATPDTLSSTPALCRMLRDREITHVGSPVSIWLSTAPEGLPALQTIVTGGEPCPSELVRTWGVERRLLNAYGPTEATICSTMALCADPNRKPHIGRPIANTQIYILDDFLGPVPIGVAGELYIGGMGVARGYLKQPGMTADKFLPDPFSELPGARMYRTGDLARYLPDGNIDFLGRIDHQVKIRGLRIELGEIETILSQHSAVREAVVEAVEYAAGDRRLVAYVVPDSGREPDPTELRGFLRGKVPQYMVPSAFVVLDTLPLTPNRKVDRAALPRPGRTGQSGASFVAPRTPVQEVLAAVWVQVLGVERVGIHDSFFDLGGHSLLGTQVISRIQDLLKVQLPLRALFEAPTVAELSQVVAATEANPGGLDETVRIPTSRRGMSGKETIEPVQGIAGEGGGQ